MILIFFSDLFNDTLASEKQSYVDNTDNSIQRSWQGKPMADWSYDEVLDFIKSELLLECYENSPENYQRFRCISGYMFQTLTEEHCTELSGSKDIGELIHRAKNMYLTQQVGKSIRVVENI